MTVTHKTTDPPVKRNAFVYKLYDMLCNPKLAHLIWWTDAPDTNTFALCPSTEFAEALSGYFKHGNVALFVRQLHMYGFHKVSDPLAASHLDKDVWEFRHLSGKFRKDDELLLVYIKRRLLLNLRNPVLDNELRSTPTPPHLGREPYIYGVFGRAPVQPPVVAQTPVLPHAHAHAHPHASAQVPGPVPLARSAPPASFQPDQHPFDRPPERPYDRFYELKPYERPFEPKSWEHAPPRQDLKYDFKDIKPLPYAYGAQLPYAPGYMLPPPARAPIYQLLWQPVPQSYVAPEPLHDSQLHFRKPWDAPAPKRNPSVRFDPLVPDENPPPPVTHALRLRLSLVELHLAKDKPGDLIGLQLSVFSHVSELTVALDRTLSYGSISHILSVDAGAIGPKDRERSTSKAPQPLPPKQLPQAQLSPNQQPPTQLPSTQLPPTQLPPTQLPPTQLPPTSLPPTPLPPTQPHTKLPPAQIPPIQSPPKSEAKRERGTLQFLLDDERPAKRPRE